MADETELRLSFDAVSESYDRARPEYPPDAFSDLFAYLQAGPAPRACEIGPGTGQATKGLLAHGAVVTAIEIGPNLADRLRRKFAGVRRLSVLTGAFEDVDLPAAAFDLVLAATSWHWLAPGVRIPKAVSLLRPGGVLATLSTIQVHAPEDRDFFERADPIYSRRGRGDRFVQVPGAAKAMPDDVAEFESSPLLRDVQVRKYRWNQRYTADEYEHLVRSYSNTQAMAPSDREGLIADLKAFIETEFDGYVIRPLVIALTMARKA